MALSRSLPDFLSVAADRAAGSRALSLPSAATYFHDDCGDGRQRMEIKFVHASRDACDVSALKTCWITESMASLEGGVRSAGIAGVPDFNLKAGYRVISRADGMRGRRRI